MERAKLHVFIKGKDEKLVFRRNRFSYVGSPEEVTRRGK
jgi:hypothetical protein